MGIAALWAGRGHFKQVIKKILVNKDKQYDTNKPISYRGACIGIASGLAFLTLLCLKAGMSLLIIGLFFVIYLVMALGIIRVRAELGLPVHTIIYTDPGRTLVAASKRQESSDDFA